MITHYDVQNLLSGIGTGSAGDLIQAAAAECRRSPQAGGETAYKEQQKEQEEPGLIAWIDKHQYWIEHPNEQRYLTRGAEQLVYLDDDPSFVIKLNDAVFYASWFDYFSSLLLHNLFFPGTAYQLLGFCRIDSVLYAVVRQPFVIADSITKLDEVHDFMVRNGFRHIRNHDYRHDELGLILEDLHDENVLTSHGVLFFVDTVFYLLPGVYDIPD
jgi:hypothetical protein